jgi:hypothetical protein
MDNFLKFSSSSVWVLALIFTFFFLASAFRDFHSRGEPREALVIQDILKNGSVILPEGYGGGVPSKPPLMHWASAIISWPFGEVSEVSARMPSILAASLVAFICITFFGRESSREIAILSCLILATAIEWLRAASAARVDMMLTAALMLSFYSIFVWSKNAYKGYPSLLVLSVAAAVLCKGPVGAVLPGLIFVLNALNDEIHWKRLLKVSISVFLPAAAIALFWYLLAYLVKPEQFLNKIYYENIARFFSIQDDEPHKASALKLYGTLLLGFSPWTLLLPFIAYVLLPYRWLGDFKLSALSKIRLSKPKLFNIKIWWQTRSRIDKFSLIVVFVTLGFYSIPEGKRSVYILPVYPFISFWLARVFIYFSKTQKSNLYQNFTYAFTGFSLAIFLCLIFFVLSPHFFIYRIAGLVDFELMLNLYSSLHSYFTSSWLVITTAIVFSFLFLVFCAYVFNRVTRENALLWLLSSVFIVFNFVQVFIVPAVVNPVSPKVFAKQLMKQFPDQDHFISFKQEFYGLSFYTERRFYRGEDVGFRAGDLVVVEDSELANLQERIGPHLSLQLVAHSKSPVMKYDDYLSVFRVLG